MQPRKLDIQRDYYVTGSRDFQLADDKIQSGAYDGAIALWEEEITNPKPRIRSRAGYNISVLSEFNGDLNGAINWAIKSYDLHENDATLDYITALEQHQAPE